MISPHPFHCEELEGPLSGNAMLTAAQGWAYDNCVPLNVVLEITRACNLRCAHCYNRDRRVSGGCDPAPGELSADEFLRLISDLRSTGCLFLGLTGGEPLTHPRLFDFLDHARRLGLSVNLLSNGTLLTPERIGRLADYPNLFNVSVSLYGSGPGTHDAITGVEGSYDLTWEAAERLRAAGISVKLKFLVTHRNVAETDAMLASATSRGFPYIVDFGVTGRYDGAMDSLGDRISPAEVESLYRGPLRSLVPDGRYRVDENNFPCNCARAMCAITATGDVYPCIAVPWVAGNVREKPFSEIWRDSPVFRRIRGLRMADYAACAPCPLKSWCTRDRGCAFIHAGSYTGVDPWVCEVAAAARRVSQEIRPGMQNSE